MKTVHITDSHRDDWDALGRLDPLYAIVSDRDKRFGGWDTESFIASGSDEAELIGETLTRLGVPLQSAAIVEVGCGAGRVGGHIARRVSRYVGVDISRTMLELAAKLNAEVANCEWQLASGADLSGLPSGDFDAVYSHLVLQHCPSRSVIRALVTEMLRVVRPGGLVLFQLPASMPILRRVQPRRRLYRALRAVGLSDQVLYARLKLHPIRMTWMPRTAVEAIISAAGGSLLEVHSGWLGAGGSAAGETNLSYVVMKNSR